MPLCHERYLVLLTCLQLTPEVHSWESEKTTVWHFFLSWLLLLESWRTEWEIPCALGFFGAYLFGKRGWETHTECQVGQPGSKSSCKRLQHSRDGQTSWAFPSPLQKTLLETKETSEFESTFPEENKPKDFSLPWHSKEQKADLSNKTNKQTKTKNHQTNKKQPTKEPSTKPKSKPHTHTKPQQTNKRKLCLLGMLTPGLHTYVIYSPHVNNLCWWGITATSESKNHPAFHNYLVFAIMNFSSPPVKVSITKQGVSSFYENQLKW